MAHNHEELNRKLKKSFNEFGLLLEEASIIAEKERKSVEALILHGAPKDKITYEVFMFSEIASIYDEALTIVIDMGTDLKIQKERLSLVCKNFWRHLDHEMLNDLIESESREAQ